VVGFDIARQIPHPGYALGSAEDLKTLEQEVKARGSQALVFAGDVRDDAAITKAVNDTMTQFGRIDILFNNAGICFYGKSHELTKKPGTQCSTSTSKARGSSPAESFPS